jgi:predicted helicase
MRIKRGVYYTPLAVVNWMVRSVDELLASHFKKPLGLADDRTIILDPATGTATFLYSVVRRIYERMIEQGFEDDWNNYVARSLLPRLFGFELMMAPYCVAHLKIGLLLSQLNYTSGTGEQPGIFLTNALADHSIARRNLPFAADTVLVILGNPPYSKRSYNKGKGIRRVEKFLERYKATIKNEEIQIQALSNDYIKFIAFAHEQVERTGKGIIAYVTDNSYLDGPLFRDLRRDFLQSFTDIFILNLHGNLRKREDETENVFEIKQGVAIMMLVLDPDRNKSLKIHYHSVIGSRQSKYDYLNDTSVQSVAWSQWVPEPPHYLFVPTKRVFFEEWENGFPVTYIFGGKSRQGSKLAFFGAGFATRHDGFAIAFSEQELLGKVRALIDPSATEKELRDKFKLCTTRHWSFDRARKGLNEDYAKSNTISLLYRPFDFRFTVYSPFVIGEMRNDVMSHLLAPNLALVTTRRSTGRPFDNFFVSDRPVEYKAGSHDRNTQVFPLYLYLRADRQPNINTAFVSDLEQRLRMQFIGSGGGDLRLTFGPEDIFHYAYAIFHCPTYRQRYAEFLNLEFPRLPVTHDKKLFAELVGRGARLVDLHLLRLPGSTGVGGAGGASVLAQPSVKYREPGSNRVECVTYLETQGRVYINEGQYFEGIDKYIWEMELCGYRPAKDWLKARKRRKLAPDEIRHYMRLIIALRETRQIMKQLDQLVSRWPLE